MGTNVRQSYNTIIRLPKVRMPRQVGTVELSCSRRAVEWANNLRVTFRCIIQPSKNPSFVQPDHGALARPGRPGKRLLGELIARARGQQPL